MPSVRSTCVWLGACGRGKCTGGAKEHRVLSLELWARWLGDGSVAHLGSLAAEHADEGEDGNLIALPRHAAVVEKPDDLWVELGREGVR